MKSSVSQLDFGWVACTLGEIGKVSMCKRILKNQTSSKGDIPFYKIGTFGKEPNAFISNDIYQEFRTKFSFPKKGDILISASGTIGRRVIYDGKPAYFQDSNIVWIDNNEKKVLNEYLFLFYEACDWNPSKGATIARLYNDDLRRIQIQFPSDLEEQKRIVSILDSVFTDLEQARAKTEQNLKSARELFDSYLQQVFSQKGEGWVDLPLGRVCTFKHGFAFKSEFFVDKSDLILLTPGNFYEDGGYRDRGGKQKYYKGEFPKEFLLSEGSLLVAMTEQAAGLLGSSALVPKGHNFLHNQRLGLVEITSEFKNKVSLKFLFHLFNTKHFRQKVQKTATGLKVRHTSPKKMEVISVPFLMNLNEQEAIAHKLFKAKERATELETIYQKKLNAIDELKKSILQKAFSGELTNTIE